MFVYVGLIVKFCESTQVWTTCERFTVNTETTYLTIGNTPFLPSASVLRVGLGMVFKFIYRSGLVWKAGHSMQA